MKRKANAVKYDRLAGGRLYYGAPFVLIFHFGLLPNTIPFSFFIFILHIHFRFSFSYQLLNTCWVIECRCQ
jgi:hypothetical protein